MLDAISLDSRPNLVVVGIDSPVLVIVVLLGVVFLVISEEGVQIEALFEVLDDLLAAELLHHVEVAILVDAGVQQSVPMHALQLDVRVVVLVLETKSPGEIDVGPLEDKHSLLTPSKLLQIVVFRENLHS